MASNSGGEGAFLFAWGLGGTLSLVGALCYAELATAYPDAGGDYHFLRRAFGYRLAFLFAWARLAVIQTGSIALLAFIVGDYAARLSTNPSSSAVYAALVVGLSHGARRGGDSSLQRCAERVDERRGPRTPPGGGRGVVGVNMR